MEEKEFVAFVEQLEYYERQHPANYRLRVGLLAALGYLLLFGVLVLILLFVFVVLYLRAINYLIIQILVLLLGAAFLIAQSLWIEFPEPEGDEVKYEDAPGLFELVREVRAVTGGPKLRKILLTREYNASIVQRPRLGVFGWHENYLRVGLPLLTSMSPAEIRAVLAHEFGHLSGRHGQFASWIYRVRQTWTQVLENIKKHPRYGLEVFERFFNWYAPYFWAYSFVLARAHEYEADRCAVGVAGKETTARVLINLELKVRALNEVFWPALHARADTDPQPPRETFAELLQSLREPLPTDKAQVWFAESLTARHRYDDTHPALADRLAVIGYANVRETADLNAFAITDGEPFVDQDLFARIPTDFIERQNRFWKEQLADSWSERHKFVAEAQQGLATLADKAPADMSVEERWARARYLGGIEGNAVAVPLLREVLELMPDHIAANYALGMTLLEEGDEAGIKHLELAMEKEVTLVPDGCQAIYSFLMARERGAEAEKYRQCAVNYYNELEIARHERRTITSADEFVPHGLTSEAVEALRAQLANVPLLRSAYLVRKVCRHVPDEPSYVLGVTSKRVLSGLQLDGRDKRLVGQLAKTINYPGYTYIIALSHNRRSLGHLLRNIEGAQIYRAD
ncbi:MAG TPA: M48 family metallopeptidase [Pyrinomonadaceae bacterium]